MRLAVEADLFILRDRCATVLRALRVAAAGRRRQARAEARENDEVLGTCVDERRGPPAFGLAELRLSVCRRNMRAHMHNS